MIANKIFNFVETIDFTAPPRDFKYPDKNIC